MGVLEGKVAIITGGAGGQGGAEARLFVSEGASVVITDVNSEAGTALAAQIGPRAVFQHHNVADEAGWAKVVDVALSAFGKVDVLVNNAGITNDLTVQDTDFAAFNHIMSVNLQGAFLGVKAVIEPMKKEGKGSIINIGSGAGLRGIPRKFAYGVSKWGLRGLTRFAAQDLGPFNIRVNIIMPGMIDTAHLHNSGAMPRLMANLNAVPLRRVGQPEEIASAALYLASDASSYMTGGEMLIDGGLLA